MVHAKIEEKGRLEVVLYVDTKNTKERVEKPSLSPSVGQKTDFDMEVEIGDEFSPYVSITCEFCLILP